MTIDFNKMEATIIPNFKGGEKEISAKMFFDGNNRIMKGVLQPGASIGYHSHDTSSEIIFIIKGKGKVIDNNETVTIEEGQCHYCKKATAIASSTTATKNLYSMPQYRSNNMTILYLTRHKKTRSTKSQPRF